MTSEEKIKILEEAINEMENPNIVEPLKDRFNKDGYKPGFCDGFRLAISKIEEAKKIELDIAYMEGMISAFDQSNNHDLAHYYKEELAKFKS